MIRWLLRRAMSGSRRSREAPSNSLLRLAQSGSACYFRSLAASRAPDQLENSRSPATRPSVIPE
jgi:hypothetical protein